MQKPQIPANESARLEALRHYNILDTAPEQDFDDLVGQLSQRFGWAA